MYVDVRYVAAVDVLVKLELLIFARLPKSSFTTVHPEVVLKEALFKDLQLENAELPIVVTPFGIVMLVRL